MTEAKNVRIDSAEISPRQSDAETKPFVVVGIPAFNEEKTIGKVVLQSQRYADKVVVCDDGCTDLTGEIARRLGADVVRHAKNFGYGAAHFVLNVVHAFSHKGRIGLRRKTDRSIRCFLLLRNARMLPSILEAALTFLKPLTGFLQALLKTLYLSLTLMNLEVRTRRKVSQLLKTLLELLEGSP